MAIEERLDELGEEENISLDIKIENLVASASLDQKIDLLAIMKVFRNVEYRPKTATLIFGSGKTVCTGAKYEDMVTEAVEKLHVILQDYDLLYYD